MRQVHFMCKQTGCVQKDGFALGASLTITLANLWQKWYEVVLTRSIAQCCLPEKDLYGKYSEGKKTVTYGSKSVDCESRLN